MEPVEITPLRQLSRIGIDIFRNMILENLGLAHYPFRNTPALFDARCTATEVPSVSGVLLQLFYRASQTAYLFENSWRASSRRHDLSFSAAFW